MLSQPLGNVLKNQAPKSRKGSANEQKENDSNMENLEEQKLPRATTLKGEVSNINHIFEHVLEEGKKVNESLKTINT